jgi:hypothetical protein
MERDPENSPLGGEEFEQQQSHRGGEEFEQQQAQTQLGAIAIESADAAVPWHQRMLEARQAYAAGAPESVEYLTETAAT